MTAKRQKATTSGTATDLISVGCKIPKDLKDRIKGIARREDRIYQRLVRRALEEFADKRDQESRVSA